MGNTLQVDSLIANEFAFEISGEAVSGVFRVGGLVTYATDSEGNRIKPAFEVSKMVERDGHNLFNTWLRETVDARDSDENPTRDIAVVAIDDGVEIRRWHVKGAWIQSVSYSDFDSSSFEMVAETFIIGYDDIEESWTATDS
ncbi:MAG: phage tail protein [Phototrophicaceae bacterium]